MKKHKLLAVFLALVMTLSLLPTAALAAASESLQDGIFVASVAVRDQDSTTYYYYDSLAEAAADAKSGNTITLLTDIENTGNISLKSGVTLDGQNHKISGKSAVTINAGGGTVKNTHFKNIHNDTVVDQSTCDYYGWTSKTGNQSAIYCNNLTGTAIITGCTFETVDWDAIQIAGKPSADAKIQVTGNTFKNPDASVEQLRYIHIQFSSSIKIAELTVNDNLFYKPANSYKTEAIGVWYAKLNETGYDLRENYIEEIAQTGIFGSGSSSSPWTNMLYYFYPMRSSVSSDEADIYPAASYGSTAYNTLQDAIDSTTSYVYLMQDNAENVTIPEGRTITIYPSFFEMTGTVTNNGTLTISSGTNTEGTAAVTNNGTLTLNCDAATGFTVSNSGTLKITGGAAYDLTKLTNAGTGTVAITGGTFITEPAAAMIVDSYIANSNGDGTYTVAKLTADQATEAGKKVATSTSSSAYFYNTVEDGIAAGKTTLYLRADYADNITIPAGKSLTLNLNGKSLTGVVTNNGTLTMKDPAQVVNNGTLKITGGATHDVNQITNAAGATVAITGGTFNAKPDDAWIAFGYIAESAEGAYTVGLMTDEQAIAAGATARYNSSTSTSRKYYKTVQEGIQNGALHLLANVNEDVTKNGMIDLYCDNYTFTGSLSCPGNILYIDDGTAVLNHIECSTFNGGYSAGVANVTVKSGTATAIKVAKNATVRIEGGTYTGSITVTSGGTGSLTITGGTFSSNPSAFVSEPYGVTDNGDGTFTVAVSEGHAHSLTIHVDAVEPTCTTEGNIEYWQCDLCDKRFSDDAGTAEITTSVKIPAQHTVVTDAAVAATCTTDGKTAGSHCSVCGATLVAQTTVPAAGHTFGDWNVTKEPTTTEAGSKTRECSVCHVEETVTIPALGVTTFTITPSVTNGTITPSEAVEVEEGGSQRFDFAPSTGYELGSVKVDGSDVDATTYYTFANVTADHTIVVVFTAKTPDTIPVESVTLNMTNMTLHGIGASNSTMPLTVTVTPANATDKAVTFSSSNEAVATVDQDGYVVAKAAGTAIITATVGGKTATCTVTVIIETEPETVQVGFKVTPASAAIVVKDASGNTVSANDDGSYTLLVGETYTYTISATGYKTKTASFMPSADEGGDLVTVTLTKQSTGGGGGGSTGGGSSSGGSTGGSSSGTTTEKNPDGSTTTTTTDKATGTVTETTKNTDGSTTTVETKKDGTVTETNKAADGTTGTVVTDKNGDVTEVKSTVSSTAAKEAAKTGEAVTLPVEVPAAKTTEDAPAVQVTVPRSADSVKVEIPVEQVTPGTVAVIVNADGTEKIVSTSMVTENGVALKLDGSATVKIIDNSKSFTDVPATNVFYNEISSLSAREIMIGKTGDKFDLHSSVTLDQIANVAGRIIGAVDVKDFNAGVAWGAESGLQTGNVAATRGDVLKALYIAAGSPAVEDTTILARFKDAASIPADMAVITAWAAQNGILKGNVDGSAGLGANVTRGQACALAGRTMGTLA